MKNRQNFFDKFSEEILGTVMLAIFISVLIFISNYYIGWSLVILAGLGTLMYFIDFYSAKPGDKINGMVLLAPLLIAIIGSLIIFFSDSNVDILHSFPEEKQLNHIPQIPR